MRVRLPLMVASVCVYLAPVLLAQDAAKVDPKHYTVASENAKVRILKVHYGPHEKSVMHSHPDVVAVFMTDTNVEFTLPDGTKQRTELKAGEPLFAPAGTHLPENLSDKAMDGIVIELKGKPLKVVKPAKPAKPAKAATPKA